MIKPGVCWDRDSQPSGYLCSCQRDFPATISHQTKRPVPRYPRLLISTNMKTRTAALFLFFLTILIAHSQNDRLPIKLGTFKQGIEIVPFSYKERSGAKTSTL